MASFLRVQRTFRLHDRHRRGGHGAIVMHKKTWRPVQFEITEQTRAAVTAWIATAHLKPEQFLFPSRAYLGPVLRKNL